MDTQSFRDLHKKYAPDEAMFALVWGHCVIVADIAKELMEQSSLSINKELALAGALAHDIGVYTIPFTFQGQHALWDKDDYILHGLRGAQLLQNEGYPPALLDIVKRHIGVGIEREEIVARNLPLPRQDFIPETLEEKLVAYADNFHSKAPKFNTYEEAEEKLRQFGQDKITRLAEFRALFGIPQLTNVNL